jgi:hypothetical protein
MNLLNLEVNSVGAMTTPNSMKALMCKDTFYYDVYHMLQWVRSFLTRVPVLQMTSEVAKVLPLFL